MDREAAFDPRAVGLRLDHQVLDADVGERAAHHHLVMAAPRAVAVEVALGHAVFEQPATRGRGFLDRAGRRDVVGRDRIAEDRERARALHRLDAPGLHRKAGEKRRLSDVGRSRPGVRAAAGALDFLPQLAGVGRDVRVVGTERIAVHRVLHQRFDLFAGRPDVAEPDLAPPGAAPDRLGHQVASARCRRSRTRPPAAARRGSWPSDSGGCELRSCGCPTARRRTPDRS